MYQYSTSLPPSQPSPLNWEGAKGSVSEQLIAYAVLIDNTRSLDVMRAIKSTPLIPLKLHQGYKLQLTFPPQLGGGLGWGKYVDIQPFHSHPNLPPARGRS